MPMPIPYGPMPMPMLPDAGARTSDATGDSYPMLANIFADKLPDATGEHRPDAASYRR
jgi:hypothetical protein